MRKDAATIQSMFAEIAPTYDRLNHLLSFNIDKRWRRRTVELARAEGEVLDVCTGTGDLAAAFERPVVGIDFCAPMLRFGKDKTACRQVRFLRGDALHLPFPPDHFDVASVGFGIRNVGDLDRGLEELVRVVRPGGRVAVLEFMRPRNPLCSFYLGRVLPFLGNLISRSRAYSYLNRSVVDWTSREDLAERMKRAGCSSVEVHPLTFGLAAVHLGVKRRGKQPD